MRFFKVALFIAFAGLSACFEPKEGCLDIAAINFDAAADKDCCCTYPQMIWSVEQQYDTLVFFNDSLYPADDGHLFRIRSVAFYLSEFEAIQNGASFRINETIDLKTRAGADTVTRSFINDFLLLRRTPIEYAVGTIRQDGFFETLKFRVGLSPDAQKILPNKAPAGHPLAAQTDSLWRGDNNGFVFMQVVVQRDSMAMTPSDTLRFMESDLGAFIFEANGPFLHETGYNFPLKLGINYREMFRGINWTADDIPAWKTKIIANLPLVFNVSQ
ncbi:MAG: hypothetical protein SFV22_07205 [Saprospiraceae bacterium]|nr:hypothetical protein [Saprospiraceae bacterium]